MAKPGLKQSALMRLRRIIGQVQGLARMVSEERPAMEILNQVTAAEAALHGVARIILKDHLEVCLLTGSKAKNADERGSNIDEVLRIFAAMRPK